MTNRSRRPLFASAWVLSITSCLLVPVLLCRTPAFGQGRAKPKTFKRTKFKPTCANPNYPMPAPAKLPAIDSQCGLSGAGAGPEGVQDSAKNNFCATGTPEAITIDDLIKLQQQVEGDPTINFGSQNIPIYKFEVCTGDCDGAGKWVTLDEWAKPN